LTQLDETHCDVTLANETHKKRVKAQYDKIIRPRVFFEGDLVLLYDQPDHENLRDGKFDPMWHGPYIVKRVLEKGLMIWYITMEFPWVNLEMVFTLNGTMLRVILHMCFINIVTYFSVLLFPFSSIYGY
jgi:hypothetical protein